MDKITCLECANEIELEDDKEYKVDDIIECPHCGTELVVLEANEDSLEVEIVEEEK
jgi:DNA-directed RNA polymerase subunit RPC12/RpoP